MNLSLDRTTWSEIFYADPMLYYEGYCLVQAGGAYKGPKQGSVMDFRRQPTTERPE